jgi:Domain of unknown function (DUF4390)
MVTLLLSGPYMAAAVAALLLAVAPPAQAELRVSDLDVFLNDLEVTVHTALLGAIPAAVTDGLESGIPTHVRYTVELWQFNRLWRDRLVTSRVVERHLTYNVVTKEFRVTSAKGETRPPYMTRELRDAQRVLSELRGLKLAPASSLDPAEIFYVRVRAETALNGDTSMLARMAGTAEQAMRQSDYRTIRRVQ